MKKILDNLALINLNAFATASGINIAGSHVIYNGRFNYSLVNNAGKVLATVQFHKSSVPTYTLPFRA